MAYGFASSSGSLASASLADSWSCPSSEGVSAAVPLHVTYTEDDQPNYRCRLSPQPPGIGAEHREPQRTELRAQDEDTAEESRTHPRHKRSPPPKNLPVNHKGQAPVKPSPKDGRRVPPRLQPEVSTKPSSAGVPRVGSLVRIDGLSVRQSLNGKHGRVLQTSAGRLRVRIGEEEVVVPVEKVTLIQREPHASASFQSYEHHKAALFQALLVAPPPRDAQLYNMAEEVPSSEAWHRIVCAFGKDFPEFKGGSLPHALRDSLTGREYDRCRRILRKKGVELEAAGLPSPRPRRGDGSVVQASLCDSCGHATSMPFCGLTGDPHGVDRAVPAVQGNFRALLISCEYPRSGRELRGRGAAVGGLRKLFAKKRLNGRLLVLSDAAESSASHHRPSFLNIEKSLRWLVEGAATQDSLFLFYTGHGNYEDGGGIVPSDFLQAGCLSPQQVMWSVAETLPKGCGLTVVLDCPGVERFASNLPYRLRTGRGGAVRVESCEVDGPPPLADVVVIGYTSHNPATATDPVIAHAVLDVLSRDFSPSFSHLYLELCDALRRYRVQPEVALSWPALPREERLLVGDVLLE